MEATETPKTKLDVANSEQRRASFSSTGGGGNKGGAERTSSKTGGESKTTPKQTAATETIRITQIPLDAGTGGKTMLDSGSESDVPVSWGAITNTSVLISVCDDEEPVETAGSSSDGGNIINNHSSGSGAGGSSLAAKPTKSKRSPNRDDSDSDDEDENGNKLEKKLNDVNMDTFDPSTDPLFLASGFKIGFAEDRNKRFRRTMEDAHTIITDFGQVAGSGIYSSFAAIVVH